MQKGPVHFGESLSSICRVCALLRTRSDFMKERGTTLVLNLDSTRIFIASLVTFAASLTSSIMSRFALVPSSVRAVEKVLTRKEGCSISKGRTASVP